VRGVFVRAKGEGQNLTGGRHTTRKRLGGSPGLERGASPKGKKDIENSRKMAEINLDRLFIEG